MLKSKILILVSGSIAAYKAAYLTSKLSQNGFEIKIAASKSALNFIGETTLEALSGNVIATDAFEQGKALDHIYLMRWADLIICAPATANFINKIANGIGDDFLSTLALAHDFKKPFLIAPAMNSQMYLHPATQNSIEKLRKYGFEILETQSGVLACKEDGVGKLLDPDLIFEAINQALDKNINIQSNIAKPKRASVLISSGGCVEAIDEVRAITNTSTGQTGAILADIFDELGFDVTFLCAKNSKKPNSEIKTILFTDFKSLDYQLNHALENKFDIIIHAAAVSDYSVSKIISGTTQLQNNGKLSSQNDEISIILKRNPKLLNIIKSKCPSAFLIGFKLTKTDNQAEIQEIIQSQFNQSHCDLIVHNDLINVANDKALHKYFIHDNNNQITQCNSTYELGAKLAAVSLERLNHDFGA